MGTRLIVVVTKKGSPGPAVRAICLCALSFLVIPASAQTQDTTISASELAKDNLDRVAASEGQITAVLNANPGLFLELKRWVAKNAADRGESFRDFDLTDAAPLSKLTNDRSFRAAPPPPIHKQWFFA